MLPNKIDLLSAGGSHIYTPTIFPCFHVLAHRSPFPVLLVPHLHESKLSSTDSLPMKILFPTITGPLDPSTGSTHPHSDQTLHTSLWLFFFFFLMCLTFLCSGLYSQWALKASRFFLSILFYLWMNFLLSLVSAQKIKGLKVVTGNTGCTPTWGKEKESPILTQWYLFPPHRWTQFML